MARRNLKNENPDSERLPGGFRDEVIGTTTTILSNPPCETSPAALNSLLEERFPAAIRRHGRDRRPLKLKIHLDVIKALEGVAPVEAITRAVATYVANEFYLKACQVGAERVDLDGKAAGLVTEAQAEHAEKVLDWRQRERMLVDIRIRERRFGPDGRRYERDDASDPDGEWTQRAPHAANADKPRLSLSKGRRA